MSCFLSSSGEWRYFLLAFCTLGTWRSLGFPEREDKMRTSSPVLKKHIREPSGLGSVASFPSHELNDFGQVTQPLWAMVSLVKQRLKSLVLFAMEGERKEKFGN